MQFIQGYAQIWPVTLNNISNRCGMETLFCIWVKIHQSNNLIQVYQVSALRHSQTCL